MTLGTLSADGWALFLSCWLFGMSCPALEPEGSCVGPVLGVNMDTSGSMQAD